MPPNRRTLTAGMLRSLELICAAYEADRDGEDGRAEPRSAGDRQLLNRLWLDGASRVGTLTQVLRVSPNTVTDRLNRLEAAGLLVRRPDPADRRALIVELSEAGMMLVQGAHRADIERMRALSSKLSIEELIALREGLAGLERVVRERPTAAG